MPITPEEFGRQLAVLRPALDAFAARALPLEDARDAVAEAVAEALQHLSSYDPATGQPGLTRWLHAILRHCVADARTALARQAERVERICTEVSGTDVRWAMLNGQKQRAVLTDAELLHEARLRMRIADLTRLQFLCLAGRLSGETYREIASHLGIGQSTVQEHVSAALAKLKAVPVHCIAAADLDHYAYRVGSQVTIYHKPPTWGAGKWREDLRKMN